MECADWDGTPWQMVPLELKLTQKVTSDKEGVGPSSSPLPLPRIAVDIIPEVEPNIFYVSSAASRLTVKLEVVRVVLASHERATKPYNNERRERTRTTVERTLTGVRQGCMHTERERVDKTERVQERTRARVGRGAGDVPAELGSRCRVEMRSHLAKTNDNTTRTE